MIDREKVINGLQELHGSQETMELISDAIALLKEQELQNEFLMKKCIFCPHCKNCDVDDNGLLKGQEEKNVKMDMHGNAYCPWCSTDETIEMGAMKLHIGTQFCPYCGKAVKWG